jgi:hypothetical protein
MCCIRWRTRGSSSRSAYNFAAWSRDERRQNSASAQSRRGDAVIFSLRDKLLPAPFLRLARNSAGSSSPGIGACPLPTRFRIRALFAGLARRTLASKYSSARRVETLRLKAREREKRTGGAWPPRLRSEPTMLPVSSSSSVLPVLWATHLPHEWRRSRNVRTDPE